MPKGGRKSSGFSLLELLIASGLLAVLTLPLLSLFVMSTRISSSSYKLTVANFIAQMSIEELVGLKESEIMARPDERPSHDGFWTTQDNGFAVNTSVSFDYEGFDSLAEVTVEVYDVGGASLLCTQTDVIYIERP